MAEHTGGSVNYYQVFITCPTTRGSEKYHAECNDIIEALDMNYAEANVFKAMWRIAAARTLGLHKEGNDPVYDAEKAVFFSDRVLVAAKKGAEVDEAVDKKVGFIAISTGMYETTMKCEDCDFTYQNSIDAGDEENNKRSKHLCPYTI